MTDIARLGFSVDTKDLTAAEQKLRAIKPAAEQAEKKARDLTSAFSGVGPAADGAGRRGTEAFRRITLSAGKSIFIAAKNIALSRPSAAVSNGSAIMQLPSLKIQCWRIFLH
jgi:hypothetical protein